MQGAWLAESDHQNPRALFCTRTRLGTRVLQPQVRLVFLLEQADSGVAAEQDAVAAARSFGEVVAYAMKATCRRRAVLAHFGEALPPGGCSGCDVCDEAPAVELQVTPSTDTLLQYQNALKNRNPNRVPERPVFQTQHRLVLVVVAMSSQWALFSAPRIQRRRHSKWMAALQQHKDIRNCQCCQQVQVQRVKHSQVFMTLLWSGSCR